MGKQPRTSEEAESAPARERIAKRLARAGLCSRRDAETWVLAGRIAVNGKIIDTPATTVGEGDRIEVDGKPLPARERTRLWLYHKPAGLVTTSRDPEGRTTVFSALPADMPRVLSIGRLDINTEGLLLLTNDGGLARILELPDTGWLRRYRVRAHGEITQDQLDPLKDGIAVDGILYGPIEAVMDRAQGANVWMTLALREGKNREVKKVLGALGLTVNRLIRLSFGPFQLGDLPEGEVREIKGRMLRDQLGPRLIEASGADFDSPVANRQQGEAAAEPRKREGRAAAKWKPRAAGQAGEGELERLDTRKPARPRNNPAGAPARGKTERAAGRAEGHPGRRADSGPRAEGAGRREGAPGGASADAPRRAGGKSGGKYGSPAGGKSRDEAPRPGARPRGKPSGDEPSGASARPSSPGRPPSSGRPSSPGGGFGKGRDGAPGGRGKGKGSDKGSNRGSDRGGGNRGNDGPGKGGRPPSGRGGPNADRRR